MMQATAAPAKSHRLWLRTLGWALLFCYRVNPWAFWALVGLTVQLGILPFFTAWLYGGVLNLLQAVTGTAQFGFRLLWPWLLALTVSQIAAVLLRALYEFCVHQFHEQVNVELEWRLFKRTAREALIQFEDAAFLDRVQRSTAVQNRTAALLVDRLLRLASVVIFFTSMAGYLSTFHWALPWVLAWAYIMLVWIRLGEALQLYQLYWKQTPEKRIMQYISDLITQLAAAKEIRVYALGDFLSQRWGHLFTKHHRAVLRAAGDSQWRALLIQLINQVALVGIMGFLLYRTLQGGLKAGIFAALLMLTPRINQEVIQTANRMREIGNLISQTSHVYSYLQGAPTPEALPGSSVRAPGALADIRMHNVSFTYPGQQAPALREISLRLRPGETVAVVGPNGSGKTTLARLLLALFDPQEGQLTFNGVPYENMEPQTLQAAMSAVFQNYTNYRLSLREAVGLGQLDLIANDTAITEVLQRVGLGDLVSTLPDGLDSQLGREFGGSELSGGQWQRIALARALLRTAPVLVLDEPTASLDPIAEVELFRQFKTLAKGRTTLFISHRLGSARLADRILVLAAGRIVEEGTHDVLLAARGLYTQMFAAQSKWYQEEVL